MFLKSSVKFLFYLGLIITNSIIVNGETDCDTLSVLFYYFEIASLVTWLPNTNECCTFNGVTCINNRITEM